jgi:primosomal protein N' (replication factor Y)
MLIEVAVPVPLRQTFTYQVDENEHHVTVGDLIVVPFGARKVVAVVIAIDVKSTLASSKLKSIQSKIPFTQPLSEQLLVCLKKVALYYQQPLGEVCQLALPLILRKNKLAQIEPVPHWCLVTETSTVIEISHQAIKQQALLAIFVLKQQLSWPEIRALGFSKQQLTALENKGFIAPYSPLLSVYQFQPDHITKRNKHQLSVEQATAVSAINNQLNRYSCHLIEGITGSGKTEVYFQIIEHVLKLHQQVLLLVPEIGLTPQMLARIEKRFRVPVFLHHSAMNESERFHSWQATRQGHAAILVGTRSAVLLPFKKLGLIIVDEEHDLSYKQQDGVRYHARDVAILRANNESIPIVLGSATPALETLQHALSGRYTHHQLTQRAGNSQQAKLHLVDMNLQPVSHELSLSVKETMAATLAKGEQVLVFLNRRGYSPALACKECHHIMLCQRCDKPFTYHQHNKSLICHHCASQIMVPKQCEACGSVLLKPLGVGTEQLIEQLTLLFPEYPAVRIDRDSTQRKGAMQKMLNAIDENKYQLLIGTQMLAKGHHFPNVTLVVVLNVDAALFSCDFRAAEHLGQLLTQVAGRSGRASKPGQVIIQSYYPEHPLLQDLVNNGYSAFARSELVERKLAQLPPFTYHALLRAEAHNRDYVIQFLSWFLSLNSEHCQLLGPLPAPMEKRAGKIRYHLLLSSKHRKALHQTLQVMIDQMEKNPMYQKVRWSLDIDPIDMN